VQADPHGHLVRRISACGRSIAELQPVARSLGPIVTDTIVACGNWIHWEVRTVVNGAESFQLQRWQPGLARPQRIYSTPPDTALTAPSCQDGNLLVEAAHLGAGTKYTEALQATTA